jgi:hypothetical protein
MGRKIEPLGEQADDALIAFLRAELALGFTYVQTAKVESGFDSDGQKRAIKLAKDALETIHRFRDRITDPAIQLELQNGADELEKLLSSRAPHI